MRIGIAAIMVVTFGVAAAQLETSSPRKAVSAAAQVDDKTPKKPTDDDKPNELAIFMRMKLGASNRILEGLCVDDMSLVEKGASALLKMSDAERWRASNDMMYLHHSREFRRAVESMRAKAKRNNIDGAALAWVDVTMSCIRCHEWVRDTMVADSDGRISAEPHHDVNLLKESSAHD